MSSTPLVRPGQLVGSGDSYPLILRTMIGVQQRGMGKIKGDHLPQSSMMQHILGYEISPTHRHPKIGSKQQGGVPRNNPSATNPINDSSKSNQDTHQVSGWISVSPIFRILETGSGSKSTPLTIVSRDCLTTRARFAAQKGTSKNKGLKDINAVQQIQEYRQPQFLNWQYLPCS